MRVGYFPDGRDGDFLLAEDYESANYEARIRMEQDGASWAGLIGEEYDPEIDDYVFAWSVQVVDFTGVRRVDAHADPL